jgi:hypothetical protein
MGKILDLFDVWKVTKTKKNAKTGFQFCRVKIKIKVIIQKIYKINKKYV